MTISSTTVKNSYSGDGSTTTFNYTFKIFANSDLQVIIRSSTGTETVKTITTHYTVTGAGSASGGTVVFTAGNIPTSTETVVLRRAVPQTQSIDYIANDPFPAESHEEGLDRAMMTLQQVQEEVTRSLKLSRTNTMTSTEFTVGASDRANKILAFDGSGELSVTQELGTYQGNWSASTTYYARDIVKDSSNNNIYICNTNHTSSGTTPISSNTDSAKWDLLVDAASAASSATAAASSASAAATSASNAASSASAASTSASNAATSETNAGTSETNASSSASSASTSATNASNSATSASTSASNASTSATNASNSATAAASSATTAGTQATNASNSASAASTSATNASNSATAASTSASNAATSESNAASSASTASSAATAAQTAQAAAELALDNFDDVYLGSKTADPTLDNDGDALTAGDLYFNTSSSNLKYYDGSAWVAITSGGITDLVQDGTPQLGGMLDVNGNAIGDGVLELLKFIETASAVNELTITNSATGNAPELSSTGDDTNIDIKITPKGSGNVVLDGLKYPNADGTADQVLKTDGSGNLSFTDVSGGISWQSTIVTGTTLSAVAGNGYWIDTTSNACTVTLPASASVGDQIIFTDYARTWNTNNVTLNRNSLNFQGFSSNNPVYDTNGQTINIVYSGSTKGWIPISDDDVAYKETYAIEFLVVAGGGGGGARHGGGGGAGGYRTSTQSVSTGTTITVTVGDGGAGAIYDGSTAGQGSSSSISGSGLTTITSAGGARGGDSGAGDGGNGGSGGGGTTGGNGGLGNTPSTSPSQGNNGGSGVGGSPNYGAGGGGGANATGGNGTSTTGGAGGAGIASSITGSSVTRAGGGGGSTYQGGTAGSGGLGGGGAGSIGAGTAGTVNTGGGGGGSDRTPSNSNGGAGGSGVVILRMADGNYSGTTTGSPTVTTGVGGTDTVLIFTGSGTYTG